MYIKKFENKITLSLDNHINIFALNVSMSLC